MTIFQLLRLRSVAAIRGDITAVAIIDGRISALLNAAAAEPRLVSQNSWAVRVAKAA